MSDSNNYYRRRIEEELGAAECATDQATAEIHLDMARRYRDLLEDRPGAAQPRLNGAEA